MKRKKIILIITLIIFCIGFVSYKYIFKNKTTNNKVEGQSSGTVEQAIDCSNLEHKSQIIKNINTPFNVISLCFEGMQDEEKMDEILELLDLYNVKSTFIISGIDSAENPEILKCIDEKGHDIGNGGLSNKDKQMENTSQEELVRRFSKSNKIISDIIDKKVNLLKCKNTEYTDEVLKAAYASGDEYVLDNQDYLSYQSFKNYSQAKNYIKTKKGGSIISIKLNGVLDSYEYKSPETLAKDKKSGIKEKTIESEKEIDIVQVVEWILQAINEEKKESVKVTDLVKFDSSNNELVDNANNKLVIKNTASHSNKSVNLSNKSSKIKNIPNNKKQNEDKNIPKISFKDVIAKNNGQKSEVHSEIYTTANSVSYTFRGISNEEALNLVLESLKKVNAKGTFFVTKDEIEKYPDRINRILSYGNEIGNGGITSSSKLKNMSVEDICGEIYEVDTRLKTLGIETNEYMPGYGYISDNIKQAVSSLKNLDQFKNYEIFTYSKTPVIGKYKDWKAEDIVKDYFNTNTYFSLRKGEIVYFRLDSDLFSNNATISKVIELLTNQYVTNGYINRYNPQTATYNLTQKYLGYSVISLNEIRKTRIYKLCNTFNSLNIKNDDYAKSLINTNYIGNHYVDLIGFTEEEQKNIDETGTINTNGESTIFFTFDDWGSDVVVNEMLNVLRKHNVKATFFVIGRYVDPNSNISNKNPNLLRTIALDGHDVGSHTYNHDIMNINGDDLRASLTKSYNSMANVIGDLNSLRPYFRPPTLYVDKDGLINSYKCGYNYVINGNISTHDYEASSSDELLQTIENEIIPGKGNIVVMHMNNQAYYTAEALDKFLTKNEAGVYKEKYKVCKLSDYLK